MYNFIFDRKSLALLVGGLAFAGGLLFFAGVLVGVNWAVPYQVRVAALPPRAMLEAREPEPLLVPETPETVEEPVVEVEPAPEDLPLEDEPPAPEPAPEPPWPPAVAAAFAPEREDPEPPEPVVASEPAFSPAPAAPAEPGGYAVQVGAFLREENSEEVVRDLETRGYQAYIEALTTARGRLLHTVRIGRYAERREAARAASEFRARERMAAIVQPAGSL